MFWCSFPDRTLFYCQRTLCDLDRASGEHEYEFQNTSAQVQTIEMSSTCLTVTQWWLKHGPTKAFKISANVSLLLHKRANSRRTRWTWNMLKYAWTCSTVWCGSHRAQHRSVTSMTSECSSLPPYVDAKFIVSGYFRKSCINCILMAPVHRMLE